MRMFFFEVGLGLGSYFVRRIIIFFFVFKVGDI